MGVLKFLGKATIAVAEASIFAVQQAAKVSEYEEYDKDVLKELELKEWRGDFDEWIGDYGENKSDQR